jgi:hypothetical protein
MNVAPARLVSADRILIGDDRAENERRRQYGEDGKR